VDECLFLVQRNGTPKIPNKFQRANLSSLKIPRSWVFSKSCKVLGEFSYYIWRALYKVLRGFS
jgi:hypothetical protein